MSNQIEARLARAGHDVRSAIAGLPDAAPPGRSRAPGPVVIAVAAACVVLAALAVPALLRGTGEQPAPATPAAAAPLGEPTGAEWDLGDVAPRALVRAGDELLLVGGHQGRSNLPDPVVLAGDLAGQNWRVVTETVSGEHHFGPTAVSGDAVLSLGATGGATTTVYRSADRGATWAPVDLPLPDGLTMIVAQRLFTAADGTLVAAGVGTPSTLDDAASLLVWRSGDGAAWSVEVLGSFERQVVHAVGVAEVDGRMVVFGHGAQDPPALPVYEEQGPGGPWVRTDLLPVLATQGEYDDRFVNRVFAGSAIVDGHLLAWWSFDNGEGDTFTRGAAVTRRSRAGTWEAKPVTGPLPEAVAVVDGGVVGVAFPGDPNVERADTVLVGSRSGVNWAELARYEGMVLHQLAATGPQQVVAAGVRTSRHPDGYVVPGDGVVRAIDLGAPLTGLLGGEPGG